ncbi:MAG: hypothetical protein LBH44_07740 [Treponema sp.]|jgi:hypothetical protein|nr:hypothetical protein [Treponema sp.]
MKKTLFSLSVALLLISNIIFTMSCDEVPDEETPENVFAGNAWEWVYRNNDNTKVLHYKKISFTNDTFSFYEMADYPHQETVYEKTSTGTYSLSDGERQNKIITCLSSTPEANGSITYNFNFDGVNYTNGEKVWFIHWPDISTGNEFLDGLIFDKIN